MTTITDKISDMYAITMLGLEPDEYRQLAIEKAAEMDLSCSESPEMTIACGVLNDKLNDLYTRNLMSRSFGSNREIEKMRSLFTDTYDVRNLKNDVNDAIRSRRSINVDNPYNNFVCLLEEIYLYGLDRQYTREGINTLYRCFANDFYKISSMYLAEYGITDFNTRLQTRRLPVDAVVALTKKK